MMQYIDLTLHLYGPARSMLAHGHSSDNVIDLASALIADKSGRFARIQSNRITKRWNRSIETTCIGKLLYCDLQRREVLIHRKSQILQKQGKPYTITVIQESIEVRPQDALVSQLQAFTDSWRGEYCKQFPAVKDVLDAMKICDQIKQSVVS